MFRIMFRIQLIEQVLVLYNVSTLRDNVLAIKIARRLNLLSVENLYIAEFEKLVIGKEVLAAANLEASSDTSLRAPATIVHFQ